MAVVETVERTERTFGGEVLPVIITRRVGRDTYYTPEGKPFEADEAIYMDYGPKLGVMRTYLLDDATPEEKIAREIRLCEMAARAASEQGLWQGRTSHESSA